MEPTNEADTGTWAWVELHDGPMDGEQAWCRIDGDDPGTALISDLSAYGPGGPVLVRTRHRRGLALARRHSLMSRGGNR